MGKINIDIEHQELYDIWFELMYSTDRKLKEYGCYSNEHIKADKMLALVAKMLDKLDD